MGHGLMDTTVNNLLSPSGSWNLQLLKQNFLDCDRSGTRADTVIWNFEGNEVYSVKSGYLLGSCNEWILTLANLERRGFKVNKSCPLCRREDEPTLHALWDCQKQRYARSDWLPKKVVILRNYANFLEFITDIGTRIDNEALRTFCIIGWRTWFLRNSSIHKDGKPNYSDVVWWSRNFVIECHAFSPVKYQGLQRVNKGQPRWKAPTNGFYKINCCVISDMGNYRVGSGVVIHDGSGYVMATCCQFLEAAFDSHVTKIMAIFRGILFSKDCGLNPCVLESDKVVAVERVLNKNFLNVSYGSILSDIGKLKSQSKGLNVSAIPSQANRIAQRLAKLALDTLTNSFWMEDIPFCIRPD
ncbi:hypothetical protein Dsin_032637 [Dipteronia sinensis]|uniref:RNase H type-1 domain-containing protein n=1 Tax=Dipteronia sinensis TaxID=43782 RepID=A0AAD9ZFI3_9ROSI|nr:hypothetical protein Dsin_032637 [Dipteronia sinensis]